MVAQGGRLPGSRTGKLLGCRLETDYAASCLNEKEAFKVSIEYLSDTIMWYRKHFNIQEVGDRKYFIEFEGVRFGADIWLNGKKVGYTENGVMASGFDLTP